MSEVTEPTVPPVEPTEPTEPEEGERYDGGEVPGTEGGDESSE